MLAARLSRLEAGACPSGPITRVTSAITLALVLTADDARGLALRLPEAVEQDHHGRPSFRVAGKIFATLWDDEHMNVMLDEGGIRTALHDHPGAARRCGGESGSPRCGVDLRGADPELLSALLTDAWERKAPKRLLAD